MIVDKYIISNTICKALFAGYLSFTYINLPYELKNNVLSFFLLVFSIINLYNFLFAILNIFEFKNTILERISSTLNILQLMMFPNIMIQFVFFYSSDCGIYRSYFNACFCFTLISFIGYLTYGFIILAGIFYSFSSCFRKIQIRHITFEIIKNLPITIISSNNKICSICLDNQKNIEWTTLKCNHVFHLKCISEWLVINPTCPYCRKSQKNTQHLLDIV